MTLVWEIFGEISTCYGPSGISAIIPQRIAPRNGAERKSTAKQNASSSPVSRYVDVDESRTCACMLL